MSMIDEIYDNDQNENLDSDPDRSVQPIIEITHESISKHISEFLYPSDPLLHNQILATLLDQVKQVDFKKLAKLAKEIPPKNNHYLILVTEEILRLAAKNQWGICLNNGFIYLFNGNYWSLADSVEVKTFMGEAAERMGIDRFNARYYVFREQLYKQFLAVANLPKPVLPSGIVKVNLKNGTFEITPGGNILRQFDRNDFLMYQLPFDYNPNAKAPRFEAFLEKVLPDKDSQKVLAEYLGYVFIPYSHLKLEKTLLLFGFGANGKSVLFDIVMALYGRENISNYSLQSLTDESGYYRAMLANKLLNYGSEINGNLETSKFKEISSGEPIGARLPYREPFILTEYAKLLFNCNELPRDVEHTNAYFRRFMIIPFKVTIPDHEQDKELAKKIIKEELSGIFNWVLEGLKRLLSQKNFTSSTEIFKQLEEFKKFSDTVQLFLEDSGYIKSAHNYTSIRDLYSAYRIYCVDDGFKPVNKINFRKRLEGFGVVVEKKNTGLSAFVEQKHENF